MFLAAIMVLSVVAIAMAFAGGAAAQDLTDFEDQSVNSDGEVVVEGVENAEDHWVVVTAGAEPTGGEDIVGAAPVEDSDLQDVSVTVVGTDTDGIENEDDDPVSAQDVDLDDEDQHVAHVVDPTEVSTDTFDADTDDELETISADTVDSDAVLDSSNAATITADSFEMSNADPGTVSLLPGDEFDISADATNLALGEDEQEISLEAEDSTGLTIVDDSETIELDEDETDTVEFTNVEVDEDAEQGSYDLTISSEAADEDSQEVATLLVGDEDREGSLNVEVRGDFDADTDDPVNVTLYGNADDSANVDDPTQRIETLQTDDEGEVDFRGLAVDGDEEEDGINYAAAAAQDDDNFDSDVDRATLWNDRTSTSLTVFIDRTITADEINVENKDPASGVTDIDSNITLDTEVLSFDLPEDDPDDELNPFPDNEVSVAIVGGNADDVGAGNGSLIVEGDSVENDAPVSVTDDDGIANWDFALDDVDDDDVDGEDVEFTVEFAPEDENNNSVRATADLTFQPDIGDTGTISGEVDRVNDDITLGAQDRSSNIEPAEGVPVHAVELDSVVDNTANLAADSDDFKQLNESNLDPLEGIDSFDDANLSSNFATTTTGLEDLNATNQSVRLDQGDQIRAVTYDEDGGEVPLDPRSDYLVTTDNSDIELVQNESSPAVEIHDDDGSDGEINFHFIDDSEYQLQQRVELTNTSSGESTATWQNTTVADVEDDLTRDATNQQDFPDVRFDAVEDLSYDAIDEQFEDDRVVPTDYTNENGDYELLNLPTDFDEEKQYVVIAGAGDTESAVDDEAVGFANFAGYDTVAVSPNADSDASQLNTDLSVQDFEPITEIEYRLDAEVEGVTGDFEKSTDVEQGDDREVVVDVEQREIGTDDWQTAADGVEITLGLTDNPTDPGEVGNLTDEVVETEDGEVSTTFEAFTAGEGTVNVTATTENTDDSLAEAEDGEQAEITVFGAATITGDIVNEDGENLPGADVRLAENASEIDEGNFLNERQAGELGSFTFTERLDTNELLQSGQNYTVQAEFNQSTATRSYENLSAGTNDGDIVITGVEPEDANFNIANVEPGEDLEVNASDDVDVNVTIENIGDEVGTQDIEFVVDDQVVDSEELELAFGENESVDLSAAAPAEEGTYEWFIQTEDDTSDTWELNVTGDGEPGEPEFDLEDYETEDGDVETDGLRNAIDDWRSGDIETDDLRTVIDAWRN